MKKPARGGLLDFDWLPWQQKAQRSWATLD
jgi:hypothetical protein